MTAILSGLSYSAVKRLKGSWVVSEFKLCAGATHPYEWDKSFWFHMRGWLDEVQHGHPVQQHAILPNILIIMQEANDVLLSYYCISLPSPLPSASSPLLPPPLPPPPPPSLSLIPIPSFTISPSISMSVKRHTPNS